MEIVAVWLDVPGLELKLSNRRSSRMGSYLRARDGRHIITMNTNQGKYSFLITLLHELAHLQVSLGRNTRHTPHGKEWKSKFSELLLRTVAADALPQKIKDVMMMIAKSPRSTHYYDEKISSALLGLEQVADRGTLLCDLPEGSSFSLLNGKIYVKGNRIRTRYRCRLAGTQRYFLVGGAVPVTLVA